MIVSNVHILGSNCTEVTTPISSNHRVSIDVKFYDDVSKHYLPVDDTCSYRHLFGIVEDPDDPVCQPRTGQPPEDVVSCEGLLHEMAFREQARTAGNRHAQEHRSVRRASLPPFSR